jgi:hypothetical protein
MPVHSQVAAQTAADKRVKDDWLLPWAHDDSRMGKAPGWWLATPR